MRGGREGGRTEKEWGEERKKRREGQEIDTEIEGDKDKESIIVYSPPFSLKILMYTLFF